MLIHSYHGVIRAAMLSKAPRAREFRNRAENVLFHDFAGGIVYKPKSLFKPIVPYERNPLVILETSKRDAMSNVYLSS